MSAYAGTQTSLRSVPSALEERPALVESDQIIESLLGQLAERIAAVVVERLAAPEAPSAEWLDSRNAAIYLGVHRDTLRKLAAERAIPSEQDGPGCKLFFRREDLDAWRVGGGRPRRLVAVAGRTA